MERKYIDHLDAVAAFDVAEIKRKDADYGGSWKKRGGIGAFMNLVRKWDRLDEQVSRPERGGMQGIKYDIFAHIDRDVSAESVLDSLRDLRRYCMLVEAEMIARGVVPLPGALPRARTLDPAPATPQAPQATSQAPQAPQAAAKQAPAVWSPAYPPPAGFTYVGTGVRRVQLRREINAKEYVDLPLDLQSHYLHDPGDGKYKVNEAHITPWQQADGQAPRGFDAEQERRPGE
jgi:hypothetical protein